MRGAATQGAWIGLVLFLFSQVLPAVAAPEPEVAVRLQDTSHFVGKSFNFYVQILGTGSAPQPRLEESGDFQIRYIGGTPSAQNGALRFTFTYEAVPLGRGNLDLPGGVVSVGNADLEFGPTRIQVEEPVATEAMEIDVTLSHEECYVGEPVTLTFTWTTNLSLNGLRAVNIRIPHLADSHFKVRDPYPPIDAGMENAIGLPVSNQRIIAQYTATERGGEPAMRLTFQKMLIPVEAASVNLLLPPSTLLCSYVPPRDATFKGARYPSYFNNEFFDEDVRGEYERLLVQAKPVTLRIKPVPRENRPEPFSGIVGAFEAVAEAEPRVVQTGQPVTLKIRASGYRFPHLLSLPPLGRQSALPRAFAVPEAEEGSGMMRPVVEGDEAVFTASIRPRHEGAAAVPALEFFYFDPRFGKYGVTRTQPIPLTVKRAEAVDAFDARFADGSRIRNEILPETGGIFHNAPAGALLASERPGGWTWPGLYWLLLFGLPPALFGAVWWYSRPYRIGLRDPDRARREFAFLRFRRALRRLSAEPDPHELSVALRRYFTERFEVPAMASNLEGIRRIAENYEVEEEVMETLAELMSTAELAAFSEAAEVDHPQLGKRSVLSLVAEFERKARKGWAAALVALTLGQLQAEADVAESMAREAMAFLDEGNAASLVDPARANRLYRLGIDRLEGLRMDQGLENGAIHYNLGNAFYLAGDTGRSILHYRRAEFHRPGDTRLYRALNHVRSQRVDAFPLSYVSPWWKRLFFWHYRLNSQQRLIILGGCLALGWALGILLLFRRVEWRDTAFLILGLVALLQAGSSLIHRHSASRPDAVVIAREAVARKGDSLIYDPAFSNPLHAGAEVRALERRRDWVRVRVEDGNEGWIRAETIEYIRPEMAL